MPRQPRSNPKTRTRAIELRKDLTPAERKLWSRIRKDQLGVNFRSQHAIGKYIPNFVCIEKKLIIELDGSQHLEQEEYDQERTKYLESQGYKVIRFWNNDVMDHIDSVLTVILDTLTDVNKEGQAKESTSLVDLPSIYPSVITPSSDAPYTEAPSIYSIDYWVEYRSGAPDPYTGSGSSERDGYVPLGEHYYNLWSPPTSDLPQTEEVSFTAYHPKEGKVDTWHTLLVYTHLLSALTQIQEDAKRFDDQIKSPKETTSKSTTPIARGTELTIVPSCEGITFNPERVGLKWMEDFHRADFRFKADQSLSGDAAKGNIDIYVGPLIIGILKFAMLFNENKAQPVPDHEESAKMYGKDDVFISYSRKDSDVARTFKTVLEGTGLDVFLDVDDIRSGQLWEDELKRRIERAKVFQVFWSANYSQSENCKQEWEYALQQNKDEGYIRPVFWQKPLSPKPPEELNKFNFKYVELKVVNGE